MDARFEWKDVVIKDKDVTNAVIPKKDVLVRGWTWWGGCAKKDLTKVVLLVDESKNEKNNSFFFKCHRRASCWQDKDRR